MFLYSNIDGFFIYLIIVATISLILLTLPKFLSPSRSFSAEKLSAYECGFEPFKSSEDSIEHHFIIVAILFVIFDLELIYLFPWSSGGITHLGFQGLLIMLGFLLLLGFGLIYEWVKGALS